VQFPAAILPACVTAVILQHTVCGFCVVHCSQSMLTSHVFTSLPAAASASALSFAGQQHLVVADDPVRDALGHLVPYATFVPVTMHALRCKQHSVDNFLRHAHFSCQMSMPAPCIVCGVVQAFAQAMWAPSKAACALFRASASGWHRRPQSWLPACSGAVCASC
jgi:hypothetical protein